jgi:hypothetical protein
MVIAYYCKENVEICNFGFGINEPKEECTVEISEHTED